MSGLDKYIYDSQFAFLNSDKELEAVFLKQVLSNTHTYQSNLAKAYFKTEQWDSEKFSKKIGRLVWLSNSDDNFYSHLTKELKQFDCCYIRLNTNHSFCNWTENNRIPLLSTKISQHINLSLNDFQYDSSLSYYKWNNLIDNSANILNQVLDLSKTSFSYNRFRADDHFSESTIEGIYSNWVVNEIKSGEADLFYILDNDMVVAFFLYRENISPLKEYKIGFVSLIASSPKYKEKKYASNLLNYVLSTVKTKHTQYVVANTESKNTSALKFFKRNNFIETASLNEYHLWN